METLKDKSAIDYLSRARMCLHPEEDTFGNISLLANMIDLERAFLSRLVAKGHIGLPLPIAPYGLPELSAWRTDIVKAFDEVEVISVNRANALDPFLQQLADASVAGVDKKFDDLQETLKADYILLKALEDFSFDQVEFLTKPWESSYPFHTDKYFPGLLLCRSERSPFIERRGIRRRFNGRSFMPGFKYVDSNEYEEYDPNSNQRVPFFMMVPISAERETLGFRFLTPAAPLISRSRFVNEKRSFALRENDRPLEASVEYYDLAVAEDPKIINKVLTEKKQLESQNMLRGRASARGQRQMTSEEPVLEMDPHWEGSSDKATVSRLEDGLQGLHPAIFRAMHETEYVGKSDSVLDAYFDSLSKLNTLADRANQFSQDVLEAKPISADESLQIKAEIANDMQSIYNSVLDNELRRTLQLAMAEALGDSRRNTEVARVRQETRRWWNFLRRK